MEGEWGAEYMMELEEASELAFMYASPNILHIIVYLINKHISFKRYFRALISTFI